MHTSSARPLLDVVTSPGKHDWTSLPAAQSVETPPPSPPRSEADQSDDDVSLNQHSRPTKVAWPAPRRTTWNPPPAIWTPSCHGLVDEVSKEVDGYFLDNWNFPNEKARKVFLAAGFSRVTCLYFPLSKDDRIHFACKLLTVLFLIDDLLEDMSLADGQAYNERLIPISRGDTLPDRSDPAQFILYDLWEGMRAHDRELADQVLEPTFTFMRAQTDRSRLTIRGLGNYLTYRERDVGKALLSALMRFSMDLHLSEQELASMKELEENCARQISVVNDIYSWEKEYKASLERDQEGAFLCSAVKVMVDETSLSVDASKRVLWQVVQEWNYVHEQLVKDRLEKDPTTRDEVKKYMKGLEYQMSGNQIWSMTTLRYNDLE